MTDLLQMPQFGYILRCYSSTSDQCLLQMNKKKSISKWLFSSDDRISPAGA